MKTPFLLSIFVLSLLGPGDDHLTIQRRIYSPEAEDSGPLFIVADSIFFTEGIATPTTRERFIFSTGTEDTVRTLVPASTVYLGGPVIVRNGIFTNINTASFFHPRLTRITSQGTILCDTSLPIHTDYIIDFTYSGKNRMHLVWPGESADTMYVGVIDTTGVLLGRPTPFVGGDSWTDFERIVWDDSSKRAYAVGYSEEWINKYVTWDTRDRMLIACFDSVGSFLWSCSESSWRINTSKYATDVVSIAGSGALYVVGYTDPGEGSGFIWKIDAIAHNIVWRKQVPDPTVRWFSHLCLASDGNILLAGTKNFDATHEGCILAKMDTSGTVLWTKTFDVGRAYVEVSDLKELGDGRIVLDGTTSDSLSKQIKDADMFYIIASPSGEVMSTSANAIPGNPQISSCYPNPLMPGMQGRITIFHRSDSHIAGTMDIFDSNGTAIATRLPLHPVTGGYSASWDASHSPPGAYFYRLYAGGEVNTGKFLVLR